MRPDSFKRVVAKFVARCIVSSAITEATIAATASVVDIEEESILSDGVNLGALVVGFVGSHKLQPYSDGLVDAIADRLPTRKTEQVEVVAE